MEAVLSCRRLHWSHSRVSPHPAGAGGNHTRVRASGALSLASRRAGCTKRSIRVHLMPYRRSADLRGGDPSCVARAVRATEVAAPSTLGTLCTVGSGLVTALHWISVRTRCR